MTISIDELSRLAGEDYRREEEAKERKVSSDPFKRAKTEPGRACACGCGQSLAHKRYKAMWASESCRKAFLRGRAPANASRKRPSGLQVSFHKAVLILEDHFTQRGEMMPYTLARAILKSALSDRQREILAGRDPNRLQRGHDG